MEAIWGAVSRKQFKRRKRIHVGNHLEEQFRCKGKSHLGGAIRGKQFGEAKGNYLRTAKGKAVSGSKREPLRGSKKTHFKCKIWASRLGWIASLVPMFEMKTAVR